MEVLGWLLIPVIALVLGLLYVAWRGREPKPVDAEQGMEELARFREAMEKPLPPLRPERPEGESSDDAPDGAAGSRGEAR
jgi:hypothetical protein